MRKLKAMLILVVILLNVFCWREEKRRGSNSMLIETTTPLTHDRLSPDAFSALVFWFIKNQCLVQPVSS